MKTAFQTGPGFYGVATNKTDPSIPENHARCYCVRLEAYDLPRQASETDAGTRFEIIFAKAQKDKRLAKALLVLGQAIKANQELLEGLIK